MSNATLTRSDRMNVALFSGNIFSGSNTGMECFKKDNGNVVTKRKPVFRSGTFRDSMGIQSTWEPLHIDMMKSHYDMLKARNLVADIPVRDGHPGWLISGMEGSGKVIGWHLDVASEEIEIDGKKYQFLLADYEITDEDAKAKEQNGHYRNRSSEIGEYTTNEEAMFWPVYMGFAMVDFSAVEGLNFSKAFSAGKIESPEGRVYHVFMDDKEAPAVSGAQSTDPAAPPAAPVVPTPPVVQPAAHAAPVVPQAFAVNGQQTTDFAAVQAHIATLETFRSETEAAAVETFVDGLISDNRLLASKKDETLAWAKTLSGEQFTAWKKTQEGAPAHPVVGGVFGASTQAADATVPEANKLEGLKEQFEIQQGIVKMHERNGVPKEKLEKMESYQKMKSLETQIQAAQS